MTKEERKEYQKKWREAHPRYWVKYGNKYYQIRKKRGICVKCKKKAVDGAVHCEEHKVLANERQKSFIKAHPNYCEDRQKKKKEKGECRSCLKPATHGRYCEDHYLKEKARREKKRATKKGR